MHKQVTAKEMSSCNAPVGCTVVAVLPISLGHSTTPLGRPALRLPTLTRRQERSSKIPPCSQTDTPPACPLLRQALSACKSQGWLLRHSNLRQAQAATSNVHFSLRISPRVICKVQKLLLMTASSSLAKLVAALVPCSSIIPNPQCSPQPVLITEQHFQPGHSMQLPWVHTLHNHAIVTVHLPWHLLLQILWKPSYTQCFLAVLMV